jgi:hypothetical protein
MGLKNNLIKSPERVESLSDVYSPSNEKAKLDAMDIVRKITDCNPAD